MDVLIVISLILLNGLFAMSEVALLTARRSRLGTLASGGDALAAAAIRLRKPPSEWPTRKAGSPLLSTSAAAKSASCCTRCGQLLVTG